MAPAEFKESVPATEVAELIAARLHEKLPESRFEIESAPISDGGDGFLDTAANLRNLELTEFRAPTAYDSQQTFAVQTGYDSSEKKIYLESARVIGLKTVPAEKRNPLFLNSYGLGVLLKTLDEKNRAGEIEIKSAVIGVGGTATQDLGLGIAAAFGLRIYKCARELPVLPKFYRHADKIKFLRPDFRLSYDLQVVADVDNPLLGKQGANYVFAKQKGANPRDIAVLEKGFVNVLQLLSADKPEKYSGAGGGLTFALEYFFDAEIISAKNFIENFYLKNRQDVSFLITGEGKFDSQTFFGKAPFVVYEFFSKRNVPVVFIVGENRVENETYEVIETSRFYDDKLSSTKNPRPGILNAADIAIKKILEKFDGK